MKDLKELHIYIIDISISHVIALKEAFQDVNNVTIIQGDLESFYHQNKNKIDCLVSPANSFGRMAGGYDAVLSNILGWDFQLKVQKYIKDNFNGEQPVGTSFIIKTNIPNLSLIHTPTMRVPSKIKDDKVICQCMLSTLTCALNNNVNNIVIPVFGGSCGGISSEVAAKRMREGYNKIIK